MCFDHADHNVGNRLCLNQYETYRILLQLIYYYYNIVYV